MKARIILPLISIGLGLATPLHADPNPATSEQQILTAHLAQRERRLAEMEKEIRETDDRIETTIGDILKYLAETKDSRESGNRVVRIKQAVIEALISHAEEFERLRNWLRTDLVRTKPELAKQLATEDLVAFENRINKRISQVTELAKTLDQKKDIPRKNVHSGRYRSGWGYSSVRSKNPAYAHNRKVGVRGEQEIKRLTEGLQRNLEELNGELIRLQQRQKLTQSEEMRALFQLDIDRTTSTIAERERFLADLITTPGQAKGNALGRNRAMAITRVIEDLALDLESDETQLLKLYHESILQRWQVINLRSQLESLGEDTGIPAP